MKKYVKFIIIIIIILISILSITNSLLMIFRENDVLYINNHNKTEVTKIISSSLKKVEKNLYKVEYFQGLGDGKLYLYYTNTKKDVISLDDGESLEIKNYIRENGWKSSNLGTIYLICSLIAITSCTIYSIVYIVNTISKKEIERINKLER